MASEPGLVCAWERLSEDLKTLDGHLPRARRGRRCEEPVMAPSDGERVWEDHEVGEGEEEVVGGVEVDHREEEEEVR